MSAIPTTFSSPLSADMSESPIFPKQVIPVANYDILADFRENPGGRAEQFISVLDHYPLRRKKEYTLPLRERFKIGLEIGSIGTRNVPNPWMIEIRRRRQ